MPNSREAYYRDVWLTEMGQRPDGKIHGEWMGLSRLTGAGTRIVRDKLDAWRAADPEGFAKARMHDLFNRLIADGHSVKVVYTTGNWIDIDNVDDLILAGSFV